MIEGLPDDYLGKATDLYCQVMNGEFLDDSFVWETDVFEYYSTHVVGLETGREYSYTEDKGVVSFEADERVSVPKLWYHGYRSTSGEARMGYSQFVEVDAHGRTEVWYQHPWWLVASDFVCLGVAVFYTYKVVRGFGNKGCKNKTGGLSDGFGRVEQPDCGGECEGKEAE